MTLRIVDREHFRVVYTLDNWATTHVDGGAAGGVSGLFVDIPTDGRADGEDHVYARTGRAEDKWLGRNIEVSCFTPAGSARM